MKIGVKIALLVVIGAISAVIISIMSIINLSKLNDATTYIYEKPVTNMNYVVEVKGTMNTVARQTAMLCIDSDPAEFKRRMESITHNRDMMWLKLDSLEHNIVQPKMIQLVSELRTEMEAIKVQNALFMSEAEKNNKEGMIQIRNTSYQNVLSKCLAEVDEIMVEVTEQVRISAMVDTENVYNTAFLMLLIIAIVVVAVMAIIAVIVIIGITKPLKKAVDAANNIAMGDLNVDLVTKSKDETGSLMKAMENMVDSINGLSQDVEKLTSEALAGHLDYKADLSKHKGTYKDLIKGINDLVEAFVEPINTVANFLEDVATGSESMLKVTKEYNGDFNTIKNNINKVHDTLFFILGEMEIVDKAAANGDLSKRADTSKVTGAWVSIMSGLNNIVEASDSIINDAGQVLEVMSTGDLTAKVTNSYPGKFGKMKDNINNLGDSLINLISQLQNVIHTTASSSSEISATADTLAAATQEQSSQTDEVASAMEEMSKTITNNAQSAARTADVARHSGELANNGDKVVRQTVEKMREIATVVKMSADNITKLGESSKKIGEIIGVIDDIADQTNLLSLNAAIEAARAGEQGRGFAVVADSVGKLAVSTASATKEIADMIKGIQIDTEAAVKAMEKGTSEVQSGIELADNAGQSLGDILSGINELLDMVNQIAAASEEQSATSEQISKNISSINAVSNESARNVEDVATTANDLARMTETLTTMILKFKVN